MSSSNGTKNHDARPYNALRMAGKYISYYLSAENGRGHGVHSPFVFDFIDKVLADTSGFGKSEKIESLRRQLLADDSLIRVEDFGAGSSFSNGHLRSIRSIARSAVKPEKYARLLHRIAFHYKPSVVLELGTSLGLTTAYLASANSESLVFSIEGSAEVAAAASRHLDRLHIKNAEVITGRFQDRLEDILKKSGSPGLVFIDGHHRLEPTLDYFKRIKPFLAPRSLVIFDDIHWSPEMECAWREIGGDPEVSLTIDLFFLGIAVMNPDIREKEHFSIRY